MLRSFLKGGQPQPVLRPIESRAVLQAVLFADEIKSIASNALFVIIPSAGFLAVDLYGEASFLAVAQLLRCGERVIGSPQNMNRKFVHPVVEPRCDYFCGNIRHDTAPSTIGLVRMTGTTSETLRT